MSEVNDLVLKLLRFKIYLSGTMTWIYPKVYSAASHWWERTKQSKPKAVGISNV